MNLPANITHARLPETYEAARVALSECQQVDECKDWADKAAALASYARQSEDDQLERMAQRIRARAIRRAGELLKQIEPQRGGDRKSELYQSAGDHTLVSREEAAREAGMSKHQQVQSTRIASIPEKEFERQVEGEVQPLSEEQEGAIEDVLHELRTGQITRDESNAQIAKIDPDWSLRQRGVPTLSHLASQGTKPRQPVDLGGRDPKAFNKALHFTATVTEYAADLSKANASEIIQHLDEGQRGKLRKALAQIDAIHDFIATRI